MKKKFLLYLWIIFIFSFSIILGFNYSLKAQFERVIADPLFSGTAFSGNSTSSFGLRNPIGSNFLQIGNTSFNYPFGGINTSSFRYGGTPNSGVMHFQGWGGQYINGLQNQLMPTVFTMPTQNYSQSLLGIPSGQVSKVSFSFTTSYGLPNHSTGHFPLTSTVPFYKPHIPSLFPLFLPEGARHHSYDFPSSGTGLLPLNPGYRIPTFFEQPLLADIEKKGYFSVILLPDTQFYSRDYPETYFKQMDWIVDNRDIHNIKFVIHLGDITHENTEEEWRDANNAHKILDDNSIPYSFVPGNHDMLPDVSDRDYTNFNEHFSPSRFFDNDWYRGHFGGNENNYAFFGYNHLKFMVISLEFAPTEDTIEWADEIINENGDRKVIVVTHCYLNRDGEHQDDCDERYDLEDGYDGNELWHEFIKRHRNIFMVLSGHICGSAYNIRGNNFGNDVYEILTDYQCEDYGGNGWLRVLKFHPHSDKTKIFSKIDVWIETVNDTVHELERTQYYPRDPEDYPHKFSILDDCWYIRYTW